MNFFAASQSFPPILCRLLARHKGGSPLTNLEIAVASWRDCAFEGRLNSFDIFTISKRCSWDEIPFADAVSFMRGCGIMLDDAKAMRRVTDYLRKKPNLEYLRRSPEWESYYRPLLVRWRSTYGKEIPTGIYKPVRELLIRLTPILPQK
jgi:hypothetical protein